MEAAPAYRPYPSISNRLKFLQDSIGKGFVEPELVWVATPKFHGVNTTVTVPVRSRQVLFGRRNGYLDLVKETHYDVQRVVGKYDWARLADLFPAATSVTVYGELYGGVFGNLGGAGAVQREVHYSPTREFVMLDICVDDTMLDLYDMMHIAKRLKVPVPPIAFKGLAQDVYDWAKAHAEDPAVLMDHTLDPIHLQGAKNTGEGWVIRPVKERAFHGEGRVLLKVKSRTFDEACHMPKKTPQQQQQQGTSVIVPVGRVTAVLSKEAESSLTMDALPVLADLVLQDILKDTPEIRENPKLFKATRAACFTAVRHVLVT